jgi:hypothetical protein
MTKIKIKLFAIIITALLGVFSLIHFYQTLPPQVSESIDVQKFEEIKNVVNQLSSKGCLKLNNILNLNSSDGLVRSVILQYNIIGKIKKYNISKNIRLKIISLFIKDDKSYNFTLYLFEDVKENKCYGSIL